MRNTWQNEGLIASDDVRGKQAVSTKALTVVTLPQLLHTVNWFGALCDFVTCSGYYIEEGCIYFGFSRNLVKFVEN